MNPVSLRRSGPPPPEAITASSRLPLRTIDFEAALAGLFHDALNGARSHDVREGLCRQLARLLHLRLAVLARRADTGTVVIEATSEENGLWLEFQRIPERWDGGLSSHGPGAQALNTQKPARMKIDDEGFALWRAGAHAEQVREVLALPVATQGCVLELFFDSEIATGATTGTMTLEHLAHSVATFLADLHTIEQRQLLARAISCAGTAAFITDLEGTIVWSNDAFSELSGYSADEVRGQNPRMLYSGEQGLRYYRELWSTIRTGKVWSGETVDRAKDGREYTIQQIVSPVSQNGRVTHYLSVHHDIGRRTHERKKLELASRLNPETGLLTAAAFEHAVRQTLVEAPDRAAALVLVSLRGAPVLDDEMETLAAGILGQRLRAIVPEPGLIGTQGRFEYALLLKDADDSAEAAAGCVSRLREALSEPIPGTSLELDAHFGTAQFPRDGETFHALRLKADRQLADQPFRRARRKVPD